jgi:hypothetical protein
MTGTTEVEIVTYEGAILLMGDNKEAGESIAEIEEDKSVSQAIHSMDFSEFSDNKSDQAALRNLLLEY